MDKLNANLVRPLCGHINFWSNG